MRPTSTFFIIQLSNSRVSKIIYFSHSPKRVVKDFLIKFTKKPQMSASFLPGRVYFPRRMGYNPVFNS